MRITRIIGNLFTGVAPKLCLICGDALTGTEEGICLKCLMAMPRTGIHNNPDNRLALRLARVMPQCRVASWFFYNHGDRYTHLIHKIKYGDAPGLARLLGHEYAQELLPSGFFADVDVIIPMPIHWTRRLVRGYNQTEHLVRGVAQASGLPISTALRVVRRHRSQTRLLRAVRMRNVRPDQFGVRNPAALTGRHILLVDDVITTGTTVEAAIRALLRDIPGPVRISVLSLGMTEK